MHKKYANISVITTDGGINCFFALPGILHASELARGDWPSICKQYGWDFVIADYPTYTFSIDQYIEDIIVFLKGHTYKNIIVCGLSFGEIMAREFINHCPKDIKKMITHHISLCGCSIFSDLSAVKRRSITLGTKITSKPLVGLVKASIGLLARVENMGVLGKGKHFMGKQNYLKHDLLSLERAQNIIIAGSKGLQPSLYERGNIVAQTTSIATIDIPTTAIYARHDPFFTDAKASAQRVLNHCTKAGELIEAYPGGHASLVELPETYNPILEKILKSIDI